ncbi:helix-turn-helix domain-containing protein [Streptomyces sp. NPDC101237]|uniref:helix-turn-helix domain-containing protein n=1 Tax=Streptomyces sp. NPDC101237 TaxID=3366139 RepID=UPI003801A18E
MQVHAPERAVHAAPAGRETVGRGPRSLMTAPDAVSHGRRDGEVAPRREGPWHQALHGTLGLTDATVSDGRHAGIVRTFRLGHLRLAALEGTGLRLRRAARPTGPDDGLLAVLLVEQGAASVEQDDRRVVMKPGDMVFYDLTHPVSLDLPGPFRAKFLVLPRRLMGLRDDLPRQVVAVPVRTDAAVGSLVAAFVTHLVDMAADCPAATGIPLASSAIDLLSLLVEEQLGLGSQPAAGLDRLLEIKRFIAQNIDDPNLTPQTVARANSISVRYLHKLFQADRVTAGQWIQRCRLQKCRSELAGPDATKCSISAVAHRWGFTSASHFSRAFRSLYGISPAEWRDPGVKLLKEAVAQTGTVAA